MVKFFLVGNLCCSSSRGENGRELDADIIRATTSGQPDTEAIRAELPRALQGTSPVQQNIIIFINIDKIFSWQQCSPSIFFTYFYIQLQK